MEFVRPGLRAAIRHLGSLLGVVLTEQSGADLFAQEEAIRTLAKELRDTKSGSAETKVLFDRLVGVIEEKLLDVDETTKLVLAFVLFLQFVNQAERQETAHFLRTNAANGSNAAVEESISTAITTFREHGVAAEYLQTLLEELKITLVLTAHPTERDRRTVHRQHARILEHLRVVNFATSDPIIAGELKDNILAEMTSLWLTDLVRTGRPSVEAEVKNAIFHLCGVIFDVAARVHRALEDALRREYPDYDFGLPCILDFGSWVAGDRDGNPLVTAAVTGAELSRYGEAAIERYKSSLTDLFDRLCLTSNQVIISAELWTFLKKVQTDAPKWFAAEYAKYVHEPYRMALVSMYERLQGTLRRLRNVEENDQGLAPYSEPAEFEQDLAMLSRSLQGHGATRLVYGQLRTLQWQVRIFGFHLATLDVRQHRDEHSKALDEIFRVLGLSFSELNEAARMEMLAAELRTLRPLVPPRQWSAGTSEVLDTFRTIRHSQQRLGNSAIQRYIVSMTEMPSDILSVLVLMKEAGIYRLSESGELAVDLDVIPLVETIADLENASNLLETLFTCPEYQRVLAARGNRQLVLLGYSDSNKDGGYVTSNTELYHVQQRIKEVADRFSVKVLFFYGRGGTTGRGGGPTNRAIHAQPEGAVRWGFLLTEQGEVITSRFSEVEIAERYLDGVMAAGLLAAGGLETQAAPASESVELFEAVARDLSEVARNRYLELVNAPGFVDFFSAVTPVSELADLHLGSRPSKRKSSQDIRDLRAIPWVFAWNVSRAVVPAWYGLGSAIQDFAARGDYERTLLQRMYREWLWFKTVVDNAEQAFVKADLDIFHLFAKRLSKDVDLSQFVGQIDEEFAQVQSAILLVTGQTQLLDHDPLLRETVQARRPYLTVLNIFLVLLLERLRKLDAFNAPDNASSVKDDSVKLRRAALSCINGVAAGMQNTG